MSLKFFGLKTCDTCRKAIRQLRDGCVDFDVIDVRDDGVSKATLQRWVKQLEWQKLLNTRSTTWRQLDAVDKENLSEAKAVALMVTHPTLIKRPIIEDGQTITVGWTKDIMKKYGL